MRISYSQKDGEEYLPRAEFRKIVNPIVWTFRSSKLLTKIFFYKRKHFICQNCDWVFDWNDINKERFVYKKDKNTCRTFYDKTWIPPDLVDKVKMVPKGACHRCGGKEFKEDWAGKGTRGNFRSFVDQGFYDNEEKYFKEGVRAVITLKLWPNVKPAELFSLFAHEFYHWRQSNVVHYGRGKYSERKADKWAKKMTKKYHPEYFQKRWGFSMRIVYSQKDGGGEK